MIMILSIGIYMKLFENVFWTLQEKVLHMRFEGYAHLLIWIRIWQMKKHYISLDQARYDTYIMSKYLYTSTVKTSTNLYKKTFLSDMIFTKDHVSTRDERVENLTREFNIHYRACIGSFIYFLSTRVVLSFSVNKLTKFSSNTYKAHFEGW